MIKFVPKDIRVNPMWAAKLGEILTGWWGAMIQDWGETAQAAIKVDTGMAASSLVPLLDEVGGPGTGHLITGSRSRIGYTDIAAIGGYHPNHWHGDVPKTSGLGASLGGDAWTIIYGVNTEFKYDIAVYQWAFHDAKWGAVKAANEQFERQMVDMFQTIAANKRLFDEFIEVR